jgi:putative transposase
MVPRPGDYRWSSYRANAGFAASRLLTPHGEYLALGRNDDERGAAYRELFRSQLGLAQLDEIRSAANGGFALGNDRFKAQIAEMLKRRAERGVPGRPRKEKAKLAEAATQHG